MLSLLELQLELHVLIEKKPSFKCGSNLGLNLTVFRGTEARKLSYNCQFGRAKILAKKFENVPL